MASQMTITPAPRGRVTKLPQGQEVHGKLSAWAEDGDYFDLVGLYESADVQLNAPAPTVVATKNSPAPGMTRVVVNDGTADDEYSFTAKTTRI